MGKAGGCELRDEFGELKVGVNIFGREYSILVGLSVCFKLSC